MIVRPYYVRVGDKHICSFILVNPVCVKQVFDVLVVGGGATGAGAALDAQMRGPYYDLVGQP